MTRFADIQGQEAVHERLRGAVGKDRLPHAFLFHGVEGVGKTSTAFALAAYVNCEAPTADDSCGRCSSCVKFAHFQHPDLHWIFPMETAQKGAKRTAHMRSLMDERAAGEGIARFRFAGAASIAIGRDSDTRPGSVAELRHQAGLAAVEARMKVFVVSLAERMTQQAANSLLKVLEEPPPGNLIVLTTAVPGALLDTIVSRCQGIRFRDLAEDDIARLLRERSGASEVDAALAAALARGSLSRAVGFLDGDDLAGERDAALEFLRLAPDDPRALETVTDLARKRDRDAVNRILEFGLLWQADLLRALTGSAVPLANADRESELRAEAGALDVASVRARVAALEGARRAMAGNVFLNLVLHRLLADYAGDPAFLPAS